MWRDNGLRYRLRGAREPGTPALSVVRVALWSV